MSSFSTDVSWVTIDVNGIAGSYPASLAIRNKLIGKVVASIVINENKGATENIFNMLKRLPVSSASLISFCILSIYFLLFCSGSIVKGATTTIKIEWVNQH